MSIRDLKTPRDWKEIVKEMNVEDFKRDPLRFLANKQIEFDDPSLIEQLGRLKDLDNNPDRIAMWNDLKALAEGQLNPEKRRKIICRLAENYRGFLGWEGDTNDEPGW